MTGKAHAAGGPCEFAPCACRVLLCKQHRDRAAPSLPLRDESLAAGPHKSASRRTAAASGTQAPEHPLHGSPGPVVQRRSKPCGHLHRSARMILAPGKPEGTFGQGAVCTTIAEGNRSCLTWLHSSVAACGPAPLCILICSINTPAPLCMICYAPYGCGFSVLSSPAPHYALLFCGPQEASFAKLPGVIKTRVGYTGGKRPHPTYESVCAGVVLSVARGLDKWASSAD